MTSHAPVKFDYRLFIGLLAALAGATSAFAAGNLATATSGTLSLRGGNVPLASLTNLLPSDAFAANTKFVLTLNQPMTAARQAALAARGVIIHGYYPTWSY